MNIYDMLTPSQHRDLRAAALRNLGWKDNRPVPDSTLGEVDICTVCGEWLAPENETTYDNYGTPHCPCQGDFA